MILKGPATKSYWSSTFTNKKIIYTLEIRFIGNSL